MQKDFESIGFVMLEEVTDVAACFAPKKGRAPFCIETGGLQLSCYVCGSTYMFCPPERVSLDEFVTLSKQLLNTHKNCAKSQTRGLRLGVEVR